MIKNSAKMLVLALFFLSTVAGHALQLRNIRDHGALGDGVTDDAPAIRAAISYALTNGYEGIYVPTGNYRLISHLPGLFGTYKDISNQDVLYYATYRFFDIEPSSNNAIFHIIGEDQATSILRSSEIVSMFNVDTAGGDVFVKNLSCIYDGEGSCAKDVRGPGNFAIGFVSSSCDELSFERVTMANFTEAINTNVFTADLKTNLSGARVLKVNECQFLWYYGRMGAPGEWIPPGEGDTGYTGQVIRGTGYDETIITNNYFNGLVHHDEAPTFPGVPVPECPVGPEGNLCRLHVSALNATRIGMDGLFSTHNLLSKRYVIKNNVIENNSVEGIAITAAPTCEFIEVSGNKFYGQSKVLQYPAAVIIDTCSNDIKVFNNYIEGQGGIFVSFPTTEHPVTYIEREGHFIPGFSSLTGTASPSHRKHAEIFNNTLYSTKHAIALVNGVNSRITGNKILAKFTQTPIYINAANPTYRPGLSKGISVDYSANIEVSNNYIDLASPTWWTVVTTCGTGGSNPDVVNGSFVNPRVYVNIPTGKSLADMENGFLLARTPNGVSYIRTYGSGTDSAGQYLQVDGNQLLHHPAPISGTQLLFTPGANALLNTILYDSGALVSVHNIGLISKNNVYKDSVNGITIFTPQPLPTGVTWEQEAVTSISDTFIGLEREAFLEAYVIRSTTLGNLNVDHNNNRTHIGNTSGDLVGNDTLNVEGTVGVTGSVSVGTNIVVSDSASIGGPLTVTGNTTLGNLTTGSVVTNGVATFNSGIGVNGGSLTLDTTSDIVIGNISISSAGLRNGSIDALTFSASGTAGTFTTVEATESGSATSPSIRTSANTGLYTSAPGHLTISTGGTKRAEVGPNGVSIGADGTPIAWVKSISATVPATESSTTIPGNSNREIEFDFAGAEIGDTVLIGLPGNLDLKYTVLAYVQTADKVRVRIRNHNSSPAAKPEYTFRLTIMRF